MEVLTAIRNFFRVCSKCENQYENSSLAPMCCKIHQICLKCYLELEQEQTLDLTCECCPRIQIYAQKTKKRHIIAESFDFHVNALKQPENSAFCRQSRKYEIQPESLIFFLSEGILIKIFSLDYVSSELMPRDEEDFRTPEIFLVPEHRPLLQYYLTFKILVKDPDDLEEEKVLNECRAFIKKTLGTYLNAFRIVQQIDTKVLFQLIEAKSRQMESEVRKKHSYHIFTSILANSATLYIQKTRFTSM